MPSTYDIGDVVRVTATVLTSTGGAVDPTSVTYYVESPDGGVSTSAADANPSSGTYYKDITTTSSGAYEVRVTSTGTGAGSEETYWLVRPRRVV